MALSKAQKKQVIDEVSRLLSNSKLTVFAYYPGTSVKDMQQLRHQAAADGTKVKVIKNRLFKKALQSSETFKEIDNIGLKGQMLYAFNDQDELAPARNLADFSKNISPLELTGGLNADGQLLNAQDVQALASLPTKQQLRGRLIGTIAAPVSSFTGVIAANLRSAVNVFNARSASIN